MGQVNVVQGPGLPFEGPLGPGADDQRRAADLLGDAGQGVVQRGGEPGDREGQAKVNMPFCAARRVSVLALIRSRKTLSAACGSPTDPGGGCLPGHAGRQAGRHEIAAATGVYFRGLVHAPHYQ